MIGIYLSILDTPEEKSRFEHLYITCKSMMYNYAWDILKDDQLAEDAVHDAFMKLTKYMKNIEGRSDQEAANYLIIIAKNEAKKIYNARKPVVYQEDVAEPHSVMEEIEHTAEENDEKRRIFEKIKSLDAKYGDPLILRYFYEFTDKEVASMLGISLENEKIRVHRAKEMLKKMMEQEKAYDGEPV